MLILSRLHFVTTKLSGETCGVKTPKNRGTLARQPESNQHDSSSDILSYNKNIYISINYFDSLIYIKLLHDYLS